MTQRLHSRGKGRSLPAGYQFGDAGGVARVILLEADEWVIGNLPEGTTVHVKPSLVFHPDAFRLVMDFPEQLREVFGIGTFTKPFTTDRDPGDER